MLGSYVLTVVEQPVLRYNHPCSLQLYKTLNFVWSFERTTVAVSRSFCRKAKRGKGVREDEANIAQLVRASVCGTEGRGFEPHYSPQIKNPACLGFLFGIGLEPRRSWVRIATGNSQGNVPMQAMLAIVNFRGRWKWPSPIIRPRIF